MATQPPESSTSKSTILIVDDAEDNLFITKKIINSLGYDAITAKDGNEAIEATKKGDLSLILMDCNLPGISGFEATSIIREWESQQNRSQIPIIALTAHVSEEIYQECLEAGMNDRLIKPLQINKLKETLEGLVKVSA